MRTLSVAERRNRLARRHFLSSTAGDLGEVTGSLIGLHGTDPSTPFLSLWARLPDFRTDHLESALYRERTLIKHLAMRRTLWVVRAADLPAVQSSGSDRVAETERRKLISDVRKAGIADDGEAWLDRACTAVTEYLDSGVPTSTASLRAALPELAGEWNPAPGKSWGAVSPIAPRVLTVLSAQGRVVRGPNDGGWTTSRPRWASTAAWLSPHDPLPEYAARTVSLTAWLRAFGPATEADVKWWFGQTLGWVRAGLQDIDAVAVGLEGGDEPGYVLPDDLEPVAAEAPWGALLPGLDPTVMGWQGRDWYLGPHAAQVFDRSGNAGPTVWWHGRIVGAWGQDGSGRVQLAFVDDPGPSARKVLQRKADSLTAWLDGARIKPRFPSPLSAALTPR